jgi:HK97 gp10 family phage protein
MRAIPIEVREEVRKALAQNAEELVAMMKRQVPVDEGALRDSIGWTFGNPPDDAVVVGDLGGPGADDLGGLKVTIYAGNKDAWYARFVEHGTTEHPARPFFFASYRALRRRLKARLSRARNKAIKKALSLG